jgi:hypothetical protein
MNSYGITIQVVRISHWGMQLLRTSISRRDEKERGENIQNICSVMLSLSMRGDFGVAEVGNSTSRNYCRKDKFFTIKRLICCPNNLVRYTLGNLGNRVKNYMLFTSISLTFIWQHGKIRTLLF